MIMLRALLVLLPLLAAGVAHAGSIHAVQPLNGYVCLSLNVDPGAMLDPKAAVQLRAAPSPSAEVIGRAGSILIAKLPTTPRDGFLEVIRPDHRTGWVEAEYVRPWSNPYSPTARCVPSVMNNGSIGTSSK